MARRGGMPGGALCRALDAEARARADHDKLEAKAARGALNCAAHGARGALIHFAGRGDGPGHDHARAEIKAG